MTANKNNQNKKPVVLCFSGHDPSGGAGIQADIEAISAQGVHAATVITALTCQDTNQVLNFEPVDAGKLQQQAEVLLKDMQVDAIKIGMTADTKIIQAIHNILKQQPDIPVIFDPVLASGGGDALSNNELIDAMNTYLLPFCQIITPNIPEVLKLTKTQGHSADDINKAARTLLGKGTEYVLVTGTHADSAIIEHNLYHAQATVQSFQNSRLPYEYHGSGCTLASSIAAFVAKGSDTNKAIQLGLDYTFQSLQQAHAPGHGQWLPGRLFELNKD